MPSKYAADPIRLTATIAATTDAAVLTDGSGKRDESWIWLLGVDKWSISWRITNGANATGIDMAIQAMLSMAETPVWDNCSDGTADKSALLTAFTADTKGQIVPDVPLHRLPLRLLVDNNNANEITIEVLIHFDRGNA